MCIQTVQLWEWRSQSSQVCGDECAIVSSIWRCQLHKFKSVFIRTIKIERERMSWAKKKKSKKYHAATTFYLFLSKRIVSDESRIFVSSIARKNGRKICTSESSFAAIYVTNSVCQTLANILPSNIFFLYKTTATTTSDRLMLWLTDRSMWNLHKQLYQILFYFIVKWNNIALLCYAHNLIKNIRTSNHTRAHTHTHSRVWNLKCVATTTFYHQIWIFVGAKQILTGRQAAISHDFHYRCLFAYCS